MNPTLVLESTVYTLEQLSARETPQLALAGRSNVGKSSLINALARRKSLARVSATPGKTRSINYYRVEPGDFHLVDLPGYGYARISQEEREQWRLLVERYLVSTKTLKALVLLLDCRLPPQKTDLALLAFARGNAIPVLPVLTKADKCSRNEQNARQREWAALLPAPPILSSAAKGQGLNELWAALRQASGGQGREGRALSPLDPSLPAGG